MLAPKAQVILLFAGRPGMQVLVQTKFTKIPKKQQKNNKV
jgi:hypothetical protein